MLSVFDYVSNDLLTHFFENYLDASSVVTCKLTCSNFKRILTRCAPNNMREMVIREFANQSMPLRLAHWFCDQLMYPSKELIIPSAKSGNLETLKWAFYKENEFIRASFHDRIYYFASVYDRVDVIDWLFVHQYGVQEPTATQKKISLDIFRNPFVCGKAINGCLLNPNPAVHAHNALRNVYVNASYYGNTSLLDWCLKRGAVFGRLAYENAIDNWQVDCIKWIYDKTQVSLHDELLIAAAAKGDLEFMQWLYDRQCPFSSRTATKAAKKGQLTALQWLRKRNCPWDENTLNQAAVKGHIEIVRWALSNGCPKGILFDVVASTSVRAQT